MNGILTKYIIKEVTVPFILTLTVLTATLLMGKVIRIIEIAVNNNIGAGFAFDFIIYAVPTVLSYIVPSAFLIALLITTTRFSSDNEIIAMKSSGLDLYQYLKPVALLAVVVFIFSASLTTYLSPRGNIKIKELLFNVAQEKTLSGLEERTFYSQFEDTILYIESIDKDTGLLRGIFIEKKADEKNKILIFAKSGHLTSSKETLSIVLTMDNGQIFKSSVEDDDTSHTIEFESYDINLEFNESRTSTTYRKASRDLYNSELKAKIDYFKESQSTNTKWRKLTIDYHERFAQPAAVFAFALLGITLGIQKVRSTRLTGFSLALVILILFYSISKFFENIGDNAVISPAAAAWAPTITIFILGLILFILARKEKTINLTGLYGNLRDFILEKLTR